MLIDFYIKYRVGDKQKQEGPFETRVAVSDRGQQLKARGIQSFDILEIPSLAAVFAEDVPGEEEDSEEE